MSQSLLHRKHPFAAKEKQQEFLRQGLFASKNTSIEEIEEAALPTFQEKISANGCYPLRPASLEILQVNLGYLCNQTCKHCHVDAGPDRKESSSRENLELCLDICEKNKIPTLDITGGAPEMHPHFRYFTQEAHQRKIKEIIVRSNLTIIVSHPRYNDLPDFFRENRVRVVSSLPFYNADRTDRQRGKGVFQKSIEALKMLNAVGYGKAESGLQLDLVYNPSGAFLPAQQSQLEQEFKKELKEKYNIVFNQLFTITNLPISRFLEFLIESGNYEEYMQKLVSAFNPATLAAVMCRNTLSVDYQGYLYDCDFNQMLGICVDQKAPQHIRDFSLEQLAQREIRVSQHCYGCTAGAGSSCQGAVV